MSKILHLRLLALFCSLGFFFVFWSFYPGFMSPDSLEQYEQALTGHYSDWHPASMSLLWTAVGYLWEGPLPFLLLQLGALWLGLFLIARHLLLSGNTRVAWLAPCLGLFPSVFSIEGVIWKDVQMAAFLLLGVACALSAKQFAGRSRTLSACVAWAALTYAASVRHNSVFAWLPLLPLFGSLIRLPRRRLITAGLALLLILIPALLGGIVRGAQKPVSQFLPLYDLAAISVGVGEPIFPEWIVKDPRFSWSEVERRYHRAYGSPLFVEWHDGPLHLTGDVGELKELWRVWVKAILSHPGAYVEKKLDHFWSLLMPSVEEPRPDLFWGVSENKFGISYLPTFLATLMFPLLKTIDRSGFFMPLVWFYFSFLGIIFAFLFFKKNRISRNRCLEISCVFGSSVFYVLGYLPFFVANDFRYIYWSVVATLVGVLLLLSKDAQEEEQDRV